MRTIHKRFDATGSRVSDDRDDARPGLLPSPAEPAPIGFYRPCVAGLPMRVPAAVLAVAAAVVLAGCSSQPNSPMDPETADAEDYELPLTILVIALIVGIVLLVVNLSTRDRGNVPPNLPSAPETPPAPPAQPGWQPVDETPTRPAKPAPKSPPKPRRRAP